MILRRLATSIRKQDWFAVVIETLIVVMGVYLGIQLGNWNAARADKAAGEDYLARIAEDISSDDARLAEVVEVWREDSQQAGIIVRFLEGNAVEELTDWEAFQLIYYGAGWTPFSPNRGTHDELISTGKFGIVGDPPLRREISDYYTALDEFAGFYRFHTPMREIVRSKYSPDAQAYMWEQCFPEAHYRGPAGSWRDCPALDAEIVAATLEALKQSEALIDAARYAVSIRVIALRAAKTDRTRAQQLAAKIEDYLE